MALRRLALLASVAPVLRGPTQLLEEIAAKAVHLWFASATAFVARMDASTLERMWQLVTSTTRPVLSGSAWRAEFGTMSVIGATVALPLLLAGVVQAVLRQDVSGLMRTAFVRLPLAILFTAVAAQLVSLGLAATDQACRSLMGAAGGHVRSLEGDMRSVLSATAPAALAANFMFLLLAGLMAFLVWLELAVRSAAVAVATLFLPLALAGAAFPATAPWARRLGETLTALVLSKLVIVAVLTLAVGTFGTASGMSSLLEGATLLGLAALAPLAMARMLPMIEAGAVAHLDGLGRQGLVHAQRLAGGSFAWMGTVSRHDAEGAADGGTPGGVGPAPSGPSRPTPSGGSGGTGLPGAKGSFGGIGMRPPSPTAGRSYPPPGGAEAAPSNEPAAPATTRETSEPPAVRHLVGSSGEP
jgi:hypothetical protein